MLERFFNPDNPVLIFINRMIDLVLLSILWTICCLPIITIGPACCALYHAVVKSVRQQRSYAVREFFGALKENLKKGMIAHLFLSLLGAAMLIADVPLMMTFYNTGKIQNNIFFILFCIKIFLLLGSVCWIYPLMVRFNEKLLKLGESTIYFLLRYIYVTVPAIIVLGAAFILIKIEWLLLVIVPGLTALIMSFLLEPVFTQISQEKYEY